MSDRLFVGIDGGGTKTVALASVGDRTERLTGGPAQAMRDGQQAATAVVSDLVSRAQAAFDGAELGAVAVGLSGAGREHTQAAVETELRSALGGAPLIVTHDADIAYRAAWGDGSGAVMIVGTGSIVLARTDEGDELRAGGWGAALGDDGSGTALGRVALRILRAAFEGGPPSALPEIAAESWGLASSADVTAAVYDERRPLASFSGLLLAAVEAGDWAAETGLRAETNALAKQAGWIATRAGDSIRKRLAIVGGLAKEPVYSAALDAALTAFLPGWAVSRIDAEPVDGALALARSLG